MSTLDELEKSNNVISMYGDSNQPEPFIKTDEVQSPATVLLSLVEDAIERKLISPFITPGGEIFATFENQTVMLDSIVAKNILRNLYRRATGQVCGTEALNTVIGHLSGDPSLEMRDANVRIGHDVSGNVYVDLADGKNIVKIVPGQWSLTTPNECPIKFYRPRGVLALPVPLANGTLDSLPAFLNLGRDDNFQRLILFLASVYSCGPQLVLLILGQSGTAKTFMMEIIRMIVDPNEAGVMTVPKDEPTLFLSCRNQYLIGIDNVNTIGAARSDAHCRIATGMGYRERKLYTNSDEFLYKICRPQMFTAIKDVIT
ncbi:MAG: hypothetical protein ACRD3W_21815, partial [Terriglobales bacterium]